MEGTRVGTIAIACAAVDDVTAWAFLAGVVALLKSGEGGGLGLLTPVLLVVYLAVMWFGVRPLARSWRPSHLRFAEFREGITQRIEPLALNLLVPLFFWRSPVCERTWD
jgi:Kef-type K+ transport system membrane component KefB